VIWSGETNLLSLTAVQGLMKSSVRITAQQDIPESAPTAGTLGFERITLEADPGAEPFYLAMGARRCGSTPSGSIPGRLLPVLEMAIAEVSGC
jgi:hypothetical protein